MLHVTRHGPISRVVLARTFLGRALYPVAIYLVDGTLIDTGPPATARQLGRWLQGQGVEQIINTHHHEDHSGGNGRLQRALDLPVRVPPGTIPLLAHFPRLEAYRLLIFGQPADFAADSLGEVVESPHYRFQVIPTPGHCPDHVCLFEPEQGWLFSGDLYIEERARYLRADVNLSQLIESLRHVLTLRPRLLLCCHAGVIEDASGAIERKLDYWEGLGIQAQDLRLAGLSASEIRDRLLGPEGRMTRITRGHFSKTNLVRALLREGDRADG